MKKYLQNTNVTILFGWNIFYIYFFVMQRKRKKRKFGRWILLFVFFVVIYLWYQKPVVLNQDIEIKKWDTFYSFLNEMSVQDSLRMKIYLKKEKLDFSKLEQWVYSFSGEYKKSDFVEFVLWWIEQEFSKVTLLEGWSIYDVDYSLSEKWYIDKWEYLKFVSDQNFISDIREKYWFLEKVPLSELSSLEGFLYPDTYNIDLSQDFLSQLVKLQLDTFDKKVWNEFEGDFFVFQQNIDRDFALKLWWHDVVALTSVVEKEERNKKNKPTVAGIFLKRLSIWMRLDADVTLCYGLKQPYELCTPTVIVKWIYDEGNVFNTRKRGGIPPHPIANPSADTFESVLNYKKTDYLYYLHDSDGVIHYGKTSAEHSKNKDKFL